MTSAQKLSLICISRFGTSLATMAYAGSLSYLLGAWQMSAAQAGSVQAAYNLTYAVSLLLASWLSDRIGAKLVFSVSVWSAAAAFLAFSIGARSYSSALILISLVGITQGGTYTPSLMLVADEFSPEKRGRAIGWMQSANSFAYLVSLLVSILGSSLRSYAWGFYGNAMGPTAGALAGWLALRSTPNLVHRRSSTQEVREGVFKALTSARSVLLTIGYTAHAWEVLGMWAWAPTFLAAAFQSASVTSSAFRAIWIAVSIHLAGAIATLLMGIASDRLGRRRVLILTGLGSAVLSLIYGWCMDLPLAALLLLTFLYGFATQGDSSVLSTAMTEAVPPQYLGTLLALRSITGFGAGAASPLVFGFILDAANPARGLPHIWGWSFMMLGAGGAVATIAALMLPKRTTQF
jgi:MFS family permease